MIAALYVETDGAYFGIDGIDPWDEDRDARLYDGPHRVVAHPPCQRWGKMWFGQPLTVKKTGVRKIKGDDHGGFAHALITARVHGGVIEHPWQSHAWPWYRLKVPPRTGGWIKADDFGGWTCCVEQGRYGHYARKPTLLLAYGIPEDQLPELRWGHSEARLDPAVVERMGIKRAKRLGEVGARGGGTDSTPRIHTPPPFRELLISLAKSTRPDGLTFPKVNMKEMWNAAYEAACRECEGEPTDEAVGRTFQKLLEARLEAAEARAEALSDLARLDGETMDLFAQEQAA